MASSDSSSGGDGDRDVFGSLPNTRPQRRSARRERAGAETKPAAAAKPAAQAPAAGAKPAAQAAAAGAKPAARAKPAAQAPAAGAKPAAEAQPAAEAAPPRAATSNIPPAGYATPRGNDDGVPRGAELVTTAVQAAGELAQIGLAAGGRALKSALGRLPRP